MKWNKKELKADDVRAMAARYEIDLITASILLRREITEPGDIQFFLEKDLRFLNNPFDFVEMEDVVERITAAAEEGEKVKIFGDRDADGITSTVLMVNALTELGVDVSWGLPSGDEPYGLTKAAVDEFSAVDGSLFITVDCGISNIEEIKYAASLGLDTIIIDHHNPPEELPPAYAILNPKMDDSGYPFRDLAGCGVVSKVIWALRFSRTDFYNQSVCLMNIVPANDAFILEGVRLVNLVEVERIRETLVPGIVDVSRTRLPAFFANQVLVYQTKAQTGMLRQIFGQNTEINLTDIGPEIWSLFPALEGKSLLKLREKSRVARYSSTPLSELDTLISLFTSYVFRKERGLTDEYRKELDLVALGTLADLMPLRNENRILIKQGMTVLNSRVRPPLTELMVRQNLTGKVLGTTDVGWQITPVINATGRMGVPEKAAELFLSTDSNVMIKLADEVVDLNKARKKLGEKSWDRILPKAKRSFQDNDSKLVFIADKDLKRGITGIIASRLVKFFGVPSIALSLLENKAVGSMRSFKGFNAKNFLGKASDLFIDYGGHDYAAGFSLIPEKLPEFQKRLKGMIGELKQQEIPEEKIEIDAELRPEHLNPGLLDIVERMEPYGERNPPLIFLARGVSIQEAKVVGKTESQHLKLLLDSGAHKWPAIYWNGAEKLAREFNLGDKVDVVFRMGRNYYQNRESIQLTVMDIKK
ncbi:MAG: single-stranded-DNA-specific exonuclease RecJ [Spirochaetales bacterium]|nr:single-stranded-DNA-specific exonuclease RecJ [Spirochaetales bacterium]